MKAKDYTGVRFGMLTVLRPAYIKKGHKYYTCRCDCGNEIAVRASYFKTGHTKSCGCSKRKVSADYKPPERSNTYV